MKPAKTKHYVQRLVLAFGVSIGLINCQAKRTKASKLALGLITFTFPLDSFFSLPNLSEKVSSLFLLELFFGGHLGDDLFSLGGFLVFFRNSCACKIQLLKSSCG